MCDGDCHASDGAIFPSNFLMVRDGTHQAPLADVLGLRTERLSTIRNAAISATNATATHRRPHPAAHIMLISARAESLSSLSTSLVSTGAKIGFYVGQTYWPTPNVTGAGDFCWYGGACIQSKKLDVLAIYNQQAFRLFPAVAPKMVWLPVTWVGTRGLPIGTDRGDLLQRWSTNDAQQPTHCNSYMVSTGYAGRDYTGLLDALHAWPSKKALQPPPLRIIGAKCVDVRTRHLCLKQLNRCKSMVGKCHLEERDLNATEYINALCCARFMALPIQPGRKRGAGLTAASEAISLGLVMMAPSDDASQTAKDVGSQWAGYVTHGRTGILLSNNSARAWTAALQHYVYSDMGGDYHNLSAATIASWSDMQKHARELAMTFTARAVATRLERAFHSRPSRARTLHP